jgi:hypothetical protein
VDPTDDQPPTDAATALRMIHEQRAATVRQLEPDPRLYYWPWGWHALVVSLAGGGGMLLAGTLAWLRQRGRP